MAAVAIPAVAFQTYTARHYLCVFCHAVRTDNEWRGFHWTTGPKSGPDAKAYEEFAGANHRCRWTRGRTGSERYLLTGTTWAVMDRDASPLLYLHGDEYSRLLRTRHVRDGGPAKLQAELHEIQDAYDRGDEKAVDQLFLPIRAEFFGVDETRPTSGKLEQAAGTPVTSCRKPLPGAI